MKRILTTLSQKWPEYLLEMLVITAGILGAYMLNDWKEKRDDLTEERNILLGLKEECGVNISELTRNIELNTKSIAATVDLIDLMRTEDPFRDPRVFDSLLIMATWFGSFDAQTGFVDEIISSGKLSLIRNQNLKKKLTGVSSILKNAEEDYTIRMTFYSTSMINFFSVHFPLANAEEFMDYSSWSGSYRTRKLSESPFEAKYDQVDLLEFENMLSYHKLNNDFVNLNEREMKKFFVETLEIIDRNLGTK